LNKKMLFVLVVFGIQLLVSPVLALKPPMTPPAKPENLIWVNDEIYDSVILGGIKNPNPKSLDYLYVVVYDNGTGVPGQRPISDVAPGIKGYNGGRWAVILVTVTEAGWAAHDPDDDGEFEIELTNLSTLMTHADDGGLDHFDIASDPAMYFLCPLHKN
jgi:hypothetical protein